MAPNGMYKSKEHTSNKKSAKWHRKVFRKMLPLVVVMLQTMIAKVIVMMLLETEN